MITTTPTICILGCGTMGKAILTGILNDVNEAIKNNYSIPNTASFKPRKFIACVSGDESAQKVINLFGELVTVVAGQNVKGVEEADVVLLCTKPQIAKTILTEDGMAEALENKLIISILAGVSLSQLKEWVPTSTKVIRAMPNTPCMIQEGMTVISCPANTNVDDKTFTMWVFSTLGRVRVLDEKHLDAVTGLSGSGPAFACVVLESLADGGVMMGLPREVALELAAQALQGAARMVLKTGKHPAEIKDNVTTPAGCTIAGLLTMEDGKIRSTLARTVQEATTVASTLGKVQANK
ncbi:pyrroline-5-carboxylate reductase [Gigaspora margarita]|uniref:Pyrroline-5-carboxylate reductase n=1 Tax=Gigaspora margarita TaxID=4874 RepID=A0A8H3XIW2_GIGMA|nr:pyrroline-5-carboxylate reductase [Gigaspora margarita]